MEGIITKGTTLHGRAVNAGERIELTPAEYHLLSLTHDIEPIPVIEIRNSKFENSPPSPKTPKKK